MSGRSSRASATRAAFLLVLALPAVGGCSRKEPPGGGAGTGPRQGEPLHVAGAADLALAFKDVGDAFENASGKKVDFSFGSTGLLAKQIEQGAPFDVFAAANISFVDDVVKSDSCFGDTKSLYAKGRIVLWSKDEAALPKDVSELREPKYAKVAIANPEHAPYGRAAQQAMTKAGVWPSVQPRTVYGENVQQTLMFAQSGNADVAIVALSLAVSSPGHYVPIDANLHDPLDQAMIACKGGSKGARVNEAKAFIDFVNSEAGRAIMRKYGFLLPGESIPPK
jgi:molybdate transport system substrate-binding protein